MNLTKTNWPLGWNPSADRVNGNSDSLLRMDNLRQDEDGALSLVKGIRKIKQGFSNYVDKIYSRMIGTDEAIWVALGNGVSVKRSKNGTFSDETLVCNGSDSVAFGDALGQVLVCAGTAKKKDDGTTIRNLGISAAGNEPAITVETQPTKDMSPAGFVLIEGHDDTGSPGDGIKANVASDTLRGVVIESLSPAEDAFSIGDGPADDPNGDLFSFLIQLEDTSAFVSVKVDVILDDDINSPENYYSFEWRLGDTPQFVEGLETQSVLSIWRKFFTRQGSDTTKDWSHVTGIRVTVYMIADKWFLVNEFKFTGGVKGQLNGIYQYAQVDVYDNGVYQALSPLSPIGRAVYVMNGYTTVDPGVPTDASVNKIFIYRRSAQQADFDRNVQGFIMTHPGIPQVLDDFYRVAETTPGVTVQDTMSDQEALRINEKPNENLISVQDIPDSILSMEGLFQERMFYMTFKYVYLSDRLNPDAVDQRYTLKAFGDNTEKNLWIKKLTNAVILLGTTKNIYEISGTMAELPDGSLDISFTPLGEPFPPLSPDVTAFDGAILYVGSDGVRLTQGSNSVSISPQLNLLFQQENRHGVPPINILPNASGRYAMAASKSHIYVSMPTTDGERFLFVFDTIKKVWRLRFTDPVSLFATPKDRLLAGYGEDELLAEIERGDGFQDTDGTLIEGLPMTFLTVFDANGQPRNRKDTFTLKLILDTGGSDVDVYVAKDGATSMTYVTTVNSSGMSTKYIDFHTYTLGFRYQIKLVDKNLLTTFTLKELTLEYDPRPEQVNYLRLPNTNLESYARKRITAFAFVIDTLGQDVTFTPYVDNVAQTPSTVNTSSKTTYIHFFDSETIGTDIGGIFSGNVLEFYNLNLEETVSEKLPTPTRFLVIPANNYGSPNRKRHTSYKFQCNTRGQSVRFTPRLDGVNYTAYDFSTSEKRIVEYFFPLSDGDVIGIDIGGTLDSLTNTPFEYYGTIVPQEVEVLPARLEYFRIPNNNLGIASRKRIRTIPLVIDTYGEDVTFTPILDGSEGMSSTLNTSGKRTVLHYFIADVFPIDIGGILEGNSPFEFYMLDQFENVEILPVGKKFDQLGPIQFDKVGKLFTLRIKLISTGDTVIPVNIFADTLNLDTNQNPAYTVNAPIVPFVDSIIEIQMPKNVNGTVMRFELGPTTYPFHRYNGAALVSSSGMQSDSKWARL